MAREIVLDTETTGFDPLTGDRLVELAALEIESFIPTGRSFHVYIDPCRDMPAEAEKIHGLSAAFLKGKPRFEHPDFRISLNEREKHGALIDAKLLAAVYLELKGGRERRLDLTAADTGGAVTTVARAEYGPRPRPLPSRLTASEIARHMAFLEGALKSTDLWAEHLPAEPGEDQAA